ncbi:hypothetical protein [Nocardia barduliensis]|uniref:hypothetical protein n=1 Tax=Nocardia barduliensis TaxID=2736643 RepID=UPI0015740AF6|nr:hypothetical protein [Nocardia barduliensis]
MDKLHHANSLPISAHLVNTVLEAVNETVAELLETAEHHMAVAPELCRQMVMLAINLMEATKMWLQQVVQA